MAAMEVAMRLRIREMLIMVVLVVLVVLVGSPSASPSPWSSRSSRVQSPSAHGRR